MPATKNIELATFGMGCFWAPQSYFSKIKGVVDTAVGYSGGKTKNPTYQDVCSHTTGHAEVIQITFDPAKVSYEELLKIFWENHDPTQMNRQGPDFGDQYRSVIFYHSPEQKIKAENSRDNKQKEGKVKNPYWQNDTIATQIAPAEIFYRAEEYHQHYYTKQGIDVPLCGIHRK